MTTIVALTLGASRQLLTGLTHEKDRTFSAVRFKIHELRGADLFAAILLIGGIASYDVGLAALHGAVPTTTLASTEPFN